MRGPGFGEAPGLRETIQDICGRVPSAAQALMASIAAIPAAHRGRVRPGFLDLALRIAEVLLSQASGDDGVIRLNLRQQGLAHQVGGTRQGVNAALRGFERRGWIEVRDRALTGRHPAALSRFAGR